MGARWVQSNILEKYPDADLKVYAIWFEMLSGDAREAWDPRLMADSRVIHYWDENWVAGQWFAKHVLGYAGIAWDIYFLYDPDAEWEDSPPSLVGSGSTIIAEQMKLLDGVLRLLGQ